MKVFRGFGLLAVLAALVGSGCGGGDGGGVSDVADAFPSPSTPPVTTANVPTILPSVTSAAAKISADPAIKAIAAEWASATDAKARIDTFFEFVRIAAPSRYELRRQAEFHRRLIEEYGFAASELKTQSDGVIKGADVQKVDGLPVYNACVEIKGSYSSMRGAESYKGQYPKVLVEGHLDVVNPETLPATPYLPIKLQPIANPIVLTPTALAAIPDELSFTSAGKLVEDANYTKASRTYASAEAAKAAGAVRVYVPGITDDTPDVIGVMRIAKAMKAYNIKPVYDVWLCGTAGEEGKGNLAGMKQLYGYDQTTGKGTNPLNFVTNISLDMGISPVINFVGSYRFEMKYKAPTSPGSKAPSPVDAVGRAIAKIAKLQTASDIDPKAERTTYTVGIVNCVAPPTGSLVVPSCSLQVDMRSLEVKNLADIRSKIEPIFKTAATEENVRNGVTDNTPQAVTTELVWFGDRPAHRNSNTSDIAIQSVWASSTALNVDKASALSTGGQSVNDNIPAALGIPTANITTMSMVATGGMHTFYEYGVLGDTNLQALRMQRVMTSALIAAGFNTSDGSVVLPAAQTIGARTADTK